MFGFGKKETNEGITQPSKTKKLLAVTALTGAGIAAAGVGGDKAPAVEQPAVISEAPVTTVAQTETTVPVEISEKAVTITREDDNTTTSVDGALGLPTYVELNDGEQRIVPEDPNGGLGEIAPPAPTDMQLPPAAQ